jgi:hypothetical protein
VSVRLHVLGFNKILCQGGYYSLEKPSAGGLGQESGCVLEWDRNQSKDQIVEILAQR